MKKNNLILTAVVITAMTLTSSGGSSTNTEVKIGNQVWTTTNLDVSKFKNGDDIPQATTAEAWRKAGEDRKPAWCYYNNDSDNGAKYGKLYNWHAVTDPRGLAPSGWHIPSDAEWTTLTDNLGGEDVAGHKMKSRAGMDYEGNGSNASGFSGLPGGNRYNDGAFYDVRSFGYWWSSTEGNTNNAWYRYLSGNNGNVYRSSSSSKADGFSVRCLRD